MGILWKVGGSCQSFLFKNISGADKRERGRERIERAWNLVNGGDGLLDRGGARQRRLDKLVLASLCRIPDERRD